MWKGFDMSHKIMVIDDLADRSHNCEILLDTTEGLKESEYKARVPKQCKLLLGAQYSLLRPQFTTYRPIALQRRSLQARAQRILVSMGGSDPFDTTSWVLRCIEQADIKLEIDVIIGAFAPHSAQVKQQISRMKTNVRLYFQVENMAELMSEADIAIGTAGTTSWERCCLGLPAIVLVTEENQRQVAETLHNLGVIISLGWFADLHENQLIETLKNLINNQQLRSEIGETAASICDGKGVWRVAESMLNAD